MVVPDGEQDGTPAISSSPSHEAGNPRPEAREEAVQILYEVDQLGAAEIPNQADLSVRARRLAEGVISEREQLDAAIEAASEHWSVERMPVIDRTVLRLGLFELRHERDTPVGVIISEAVRIAKEYSTEKSGSFVNGVLAALARSERPT